METQNVGIVTFDDVELLDFTGPYEVFSCAARVKKDAYKVFTIGQKHLIRSFNGLTFTPDFNVLEEAPHIDLLLIPGGRGTRTEEGNKILIDWIRERASKATRVLSVCTGVFLLVKAGLVDGLSLTTHNSAFDELAELAPDNPIERDKRVLDHGDRVISAGISAGIDMAFGVVADRLGMDDALKAAHYMEYDWKGKL
ncbi:MAG: DJ-1/PfpI family protein [Acidobacteriota bacterium]|nr:DJ-1/PfpI family protein [Acidobacteriota bacterium]